MTLLTAIWLLSLAVVSGILVYAHRKNTDLRVSPEDVLASFADFLALELSHMIDQLSYGAVRVRPHGIRILTQSRIFLERGHDIFLEKIFGRLDVEKGNVTSFFLKRIAEHQAALRRKDGGRV
ncbi:MAG: hypothetical protein A2942_03790 [Candidatus Lloydbacteria bacterium RIFCSPLOWO2_01_FULL_50_20]|uniref:Uncharacterized protein n=1 Tax=Candidatus Lloydbacteria bacterium RIFCSPLOWO2_01_FULL_50_20 TaxID=1798665 RepID=A0A1G2DH76_9BACT|nr:MAG: hypothetical protein A3C13_03125 [Candidatus Lloydbacteria bacterium RIFCSPHIGHO2_02_FULL_50_11]OGZ12210.1 MAG: hypothetical protein A2942_03790 [Candidatus Lloydbacteria bacterium RIFCSPLOWO2_01_FULL_50_20]